MPTWSARSCLGMGILLVSQRKNLFTTQKFPKDMAQPAGSTLTGDVQMRPGHG